ncbi:hypothetical protein SASPL_152409 [Salvia splendens]|uniref:Nitric oxide synthase-interacting protein n=1 Tax=Salvia splendens TaxID=180675 RepID=A0A8X8Z008_SALSN|nr:hypothetical protein SASPL_152409 [Salvia splendens]
MPFSPEERYPQVIGIQSLFGETVMFKKSVFKCRKSAGHAAQQKQEKEDEDKLMLQKARELDAFDQQNHGAIPQFNDKNYSRDKNQQCEDDLIPRGSTPSVTLTNTLALVALSSCGHVFCKKCADKFVAVNKVCLACDKPCKERHLVSLAKGGTGLADHLEAKDFKHLGSGSGLGLVRPATKT